MSLSFLFLPEREPRTPTPKQSWIGATFGSFWQCALGGKLQDSCKLAMMLFVSRCRDQLGPCAIYDVQYLGEAELAGIDPALAGRQTHYGAHQIVRRDGHQKFLLQHGFAFGGHVMEPHGPLQRPQIGLSGKGLARC
jgi:hypothetical protein